EGTGVELKGFVGEHGGWADIVNEVAAKGDHRSWAYAHPRAETPDQVRLFSREHPVFRFRRGTGPDGRRFSYMLEHFSAFGRANVPSYGEFGGGKVAMMAIDDMGPIIVSDRFEHTRGWWEKENREHWPLEDFWIRWADGGESYFSHGDKAMDDAEVTVRDDGIDYAYEWNESISIRKSFRDLADGIEVTLHFSYAGDEDVQEATYRIPLVDKGTLLEYTSGSEWVDVTTDYSPPVARLRLTRNGRHAYIDFDTPRRVRWTGRKFHDRIRNRVTPIHILLNDGGPWMSCPSHTGSERACNEHRCVARIVRQILMICTFSARFLPHKDPSKMLRRLHALHLLLLLLIALPASGVAQPASLAGLDVYIESAMADWEVPGLAIAVVKDDEVIYARGFGVTEIGGNQPVDEHTMFAIASTTKAFTAAALGMLVDEGKIAWDDPVRKHLPLFSVADPYISREMTIRDLLTHRTGLAGHNNLWIASPFDRDELVRRL